jgi:hypothetical protein
VKFGVLLVALSWHFAGDGPVTAELEVDPHAAAAATATASVRDVRARSMGLWSCSGAKNNTRANRERGSTIP